MGLLLKDRDSLSAFLEQQQKAHKGLPESLSFSDSVTKINRHEAQQTRALIVTNQAVYNLAFPLSAFGFSIGSIFTNLRRRIPIVNIEGLVLSHCSEELVLKVRDENDPDHDYRLVILFFNFIFVSFFRGGRYIMPHRTEVVDALSRSWFALKQAQLPVDFSVFPAGSLLFFFLNFNHRTRLSSRKKRECERVPYLSP